MKGKKIAFLAAPTFSETEGTYETFYLKSEGAEVVPLALEAGVVNSNAGTTVNAKSIKEVDPKDFDAVYIVGLSTYKNYTPFVESPEVLEFIRNLYRSGRIVACICNGLYLLLHTGILRGKRVTTNQSFYPKIKDVIIDAGAIYVDEPVVIDGNLITSRNPMDLAPFHRAIVELVKSL